MESTYTKEAEASLTLNAKQIAQLLGISRAAAYTLLHSKTFPTLRIGTRLLTPRDQLQEWMKRQTANYKE